MKYRHAFHAGNFADVHKHVALLALLRALQRKPRGFLFIDTHAGRGAYDPSEAPEADAGLSRFESARPTLMASSPEIADYLALLAGAREAAGAERTLPGSPIIAALALRAQDRGVCCENQPAECRALERALHPWPRVRAMCTDGYRELRGLLPPLERRALVLVDPPYEDAGGDRRAIAEAIETTLGRLPDAVIAIWYPIKDERSLGPWLEGLAATVATRMLVSELWRFPRDSTVALNGSGLVIVNAPFEFDARMKAWLPELGQRLDIRAPGGHDVRWLRHESG